MKPVYQLRQAKKLGGTVYTLVNDEKVMQAPDPPSPYYLAHYPMYLPYFWQLMQARMLEHLLSRLDEISPEQLREPSEPPAAEHWLHRLPRTYNWLHSLPLCYYNQQQQPDALDEKAKDFLIEKGYNPDFGARPLRRAIEHYVEDPMSEAILRSEIGPGQLIKVTKREEDDDKLAFNAEARPAEEAKQEQHEEAGSSNQS